MEDAIERGDIDAVHSLLLAAGDRALPPLILHRCAMLGHVDLARWLLAERHVREVDEPDTAHRNASALHVAARLGNREMVEVLLDHGADPDGSGAKASSETPLALASQHDEADVVALLLARFADVNRSYAGGRTALHAAAKGDAHHVVPLLLAARAALDREDERGYTALHRACVFDSLLVARQLVRYEADVHRTAPRGVTAVHLAVSTGNLQLVQLLLDAEADPSAPDVDTETPLHDAVELGSVELVQLLLEYGATACFCPSDTVMGPLHVAAFHNRVDIARLLLEHKAPIDAPNAHGNTALVLAAANGHLELARELIQTHGADVNYSASTVDGTALNRAAKRGQAALVESLLELQASPETRDGEGRTPLALAILNRHQHVVELLLQHRAQPNIDTRAWSASLFSEASTLSAVTKREAILRLLIDHGLLRSDLQPPTSASRLPYGIAAILADYGTSGPRASSNMLT